MICINEKCETRPQTYVTGTETLDYGVFRMRMCRACGHKFNTFESYGFEGMTRESVRKLDNELRGPMTA